MYSVLFIFFTMVTFGFSKPTLDPENSNITQIPESLLMKLSQVQNFSHFKSQFVSPKLTPRTIEPQLGIFLSYVEEDENRSVHLKTARGSKSNESALPMAEVASCIPEPKIVELPRPTDPLEIFWPMCTRIRRCGGCCPSTLLTCSPTATSTITVKLFRGRYSRPYENSFDEVGYEIVKLEQHDNCKCVCLEKAKDCTSLQVYYADKCKCECKNSALASSCLGSDRHWDRRDCSCKCNVVEDCSTGFFFNPQSCRCTSLSDPILGIASSNTYEKIRPYHKEDGGEFDSSHSIPDGINPMDDNGPFQMAQYENERTWVFIHANDTD